MRHIVKIPDDAPLPLIGCIMFGIIDRGTNLLQVRAISGCNLSCIFCSVDEGPKSKSRVTNYVVVSLDYMMEWLKEVVEFKGKRRLEIHLDGTGEPMLYPKFVDLVHEVSSLPGVDIVSVQTNGTLLSEKLVDELEAAGVSRINLSLHSLDEKKSKILVGDASYDVNKIISVAEYVENSNIELLVAPVWVPGMNDRDVIEIIEWAIRLKRKEHKWPLLGVQKYEAHKYGRKPPGVREMSWWKFYAELKKLEKRYKVKLKLRKEDFWMHRRKMIPLTFKKGEKVRVKLLAPGWMKDEMIGVARDRCITILNSQGYDVEDLVNVRIVKTKHNLYLAVPESRRYFDPLKTSAW